MSSIARVANWWIVYSDRSMFTDCDGDAYDAPGRDVQAVIARDPDHGWQLWRRWNTDYYVYIPEHKTWRGVDQYGLWDYLALPGPKKVLFGRTMFDAEYQELLHWLLHHPALPIKSGWRQGERD